ncbi:uncharacterized protein BHQ10_006068 [Talaromyces amestolkiae]|uniref:Uncharacterized protein n=1 Tax=Talaromyces amestolkiae TaxID=1196081 RepID=A0A364L2N4_TALAM|nr:uncharacterized protein BHQ10_006068 [Talaromyces amestolkiae]RAO70056.1 hypothetical protein BHQ10_006068 [Talaromyces amestolkiae]
MLQKLFTDNGDSDRGSINSSSPWTSKSPPQEAVVYKSTHNFRGDLLPRRTRAEGETDEKRNFSSNLYLRVFGLNCIDAVANQKLGVNQDWSYNFANLLGKCGQKTVCT